MNSPSAAPSRAQALMDMGRYQDALTILHQSLASDAKNVNVLCQISYCHFELGEYEKCLEFANEAIAAHPDEEWGYRLRSIALRLKRVPKPRFSVQAAVECVRLAPERSLCWHTLANAHIANGDLKAAVQSGEKLRQIAPEWSSTYQTLARIALAKNRYREAIKWIEEALHRDPSLSDSHNLLGCIRMKQLKYRSAMDAFMVSVQMRPTIEVYQKNVVAAVDNYCFGLRFWRVRYALLVALFYGHGAFVAAGFLRSTLAFVSLIVLYPLLVILVPILRLRSLPDPIQQLVRNYRKRKRSLSKFQLPWQKMPN